MARATGGTRPPNCPVATRDSENGTAPDYDDVSERRGEVPRPARTTSHPGSRRRCPAPRRSARPTARTPSRPPARGPHPARRRWRGTPSRTASAPTPHPPRRGRRRLLRHARRLDGRLPAADRRPPRPGRAGRRPRLAAPAPPPQPSATTLAVGREHARRLRREAEPSAGRPAARTLLADDPAPRPRPSCSPAARPRRRGGPGPVAELAAAAAAESPGATWRTTTTPCSTRWASASPTRRPTPGRLGERRAGVAPGWTSGPTGTRRRRHPSSPPA